MPIDVLGLGETVREYKPCGNITVGVNDIFKYFPVDYLILADPPQRFPEKDRYKTIVESTPKKFLCPEPWPVNNFELIKLAPGRGMIKELDTHGVYCFSNNSPYLACVHAYKLGAKEIRLFGVDFNTHEALSNEQSIKRIREHYSALNKEFLKRGVVMKVSSRASVLSSVLPLI